jgi:hypothetical protein
MKMKVAKVSTLFLFLTKAAKAKFIWQAKQGKSSGLSVAHTPFQALDVNIHNGNGKSFVRGIINFQLP